MNTARERITVISCHERFLNELAKMYDGLKEKENSDKLKLRLARVISDDLNLFSNSNNLQETNERINEFINIQEDISSGRQICVIHHNVKQKQSVKNQISFSLKTLFSCCKCTEN